MNDNGLIYGLEDRPPLKDTLFAALQHLLAIFVATSTTIKEYLSSRPELLLTECHTLLTSGVQAGAYRISDSTIIS